MIARLATFLSVLMLAAPAVAAAQNNPFGPIPQPTPQQPTVAGDPNADPLAEEEDGLGDTQQLLIGLAGLALLLGILWVIVRDARSAAPVEKGRRDPLEEGESEKGSRTPKKQRVARQRAAAKRARQQRKRNR